MNIYHPTTQQRIDARNRAKELVVTMAGAKPTPDEFQENHVGKYPAVVVNTVLILCGVALVAAFYPSAMRLYDAGYHSFYHAIQNPVKASLAGVSLIVMAELTLLICNLAYTVIDANATYRALLNIGSLLSTAIAMVGNIQVGLVGQFDSPIAYLETMTPPLLVVILSFVLKGVLLTRISETHQWQTTFKQALERWQQDVRNAEHSPRFKQAYAAELKALYMAINNEGRGRNERLTYLQSLTPQSWSALVKAAFAEDVWYDDDVIPTEGYTVTPIQLPSIERPSIPSTTSTQLKDSNDSIEGSFEAIATGKQKYRQGATERVFELFRSNPSALNWSVDEIARVADVATGTASTARNKFKSDTGNK